MLKIKRALRLLAPATLAALCISSESPAAGLLVETVYNGTECRVGNYTAQNFAFAQSGYLAAPLSGGDPLLPNCPVLRRLQNATSIGVRVYFSDLTHGDNDGTSVSCSLALALNSDTPGGSGSGALDHFESDYLDISVQVPASQRVWPAMSATAPVWYSANLSCDPLPTGLAIRAYVVTESTN